MHGIVSSCLIAVLCHAACASASENFWNKIRYSGGTVQQKVNYYDWDTTVTVSADAVVIAIARGPTIRLKPGQVIAISYGQEAHRRVADMVALSVVVTPLALFGILHQSRNHFVGIEWTAANGKPAAVLLEVHKDQYRALLDSLKSATGRLVVSRPDLHP